MKSLVLIIAGLLLLAASLSGCTEMLDSGRGALDTIKNTTSDVKEIVNDTADIMHDVKEGLNETLDTIDNIVDDVTDAVSNLTDGTDGGEGGGSSAPSGGSGSETPPEDDGPCEDYAIIVITDSGSYNRTDSVTISGNLTSPSGCDAGGKDIAIQIKDPFDNGGVAQPKTDENGHFAFSYQLDEENVIGNYTVHAAFGSLAYVTTVFEVA
ncbi:MAG: hypothetical protein JW716_03750 [Candidatus Aenigmarchaeota archaeon]|nr:hypothetical protein [Candidatus Aenigmarchaeota archaeon]